MRFMMMIRGDKNFEAGRPPDPRLMAALTQMTEDMRSAGVVLESGGLYPSAEGALLNLSGGEVTVTDGPFSEAKEVIGGYAIIQAESKAEAIALSKEFLDLHALILGPSCEMVQEVRRMFDPSDSAPPCVQRQGQRRL